MQQQTLISGDTLTFLTTLADYAASDGWVLTYRLVPRAVGGAPVSISSTAEGTAHRLTATAATTSGWITGAYGWSAYVTKGAERYTVDSGQLIVQPNPASVASGTDTRSQAEKALDDARAAFAAWSPTRRSYRIGDREMTFNAAAEIITHVSYWENVVAREQRAADKAKGRPDRRQLYVRMGRV